MGFLGKGAQARPAGKTPIGPIYDAQLQQAADLMERFNRAVGDDGALRAVCAAIYGAAGISRFEDLLMRPDDLDIPWRWLEAAAGAAAGRGDNLLPSRVFGCALFWNTHIAPKLQWGDYADLCLPAAPPDIEASLAALALPCLLAIPAGNAVFGNQTGQFTAGQLAQRAAQEVAEPNGNRPGASPELVSLARDTLAGRAEHARPAGAHARPAAGPAEPAPGGEMLAQALAQLNRVKAALAETGLRFVDIGTSFAVGVGVGFEDTGYAVLSILSGSEGVVNVTAGVLKGASGDRLRILDICNKLTSDNPSYPVFLHDAEAGSHLLVQQRFLIGMLLADASAVRALTEAIPAVAKSAREQFIEAGLGGQAHQWNEADVHELLIRSVL